MEKSSYFILLKIAYDLSETICFKFISKGQRVDLFEPPIGKILRFNIDSNIDVLPDFISPITHIFGRSIFSFKIPLSINLSNNFCN